MKEFDDLLDWETYRVIVIVCIITMAGGVVLENEWGTKLLVHALFVIAVSALVIFTLKRGTMLMRGLLIFTSAAYFYTLFFLYPNTSLNIILLAITPMLAILFFHKILFYTLLVMNTVFAAGLFLYVHFGSSGRLYEHLDGDFSGNFINFAASQIMIFFIFFLTSRRIDKLHVYYEEIQKAERLKTTGQLAAAVAHEIRNPITVVSGFLQMYRHDEEIPLRVRQNIQLMLDELNVAEHVIQDFLSLAKPREEQTECTHIQHTLHGVVDLLSSYAVMNDISISIEAEGDAYIACNSVEFKQVMINILKNSIEAIRYGGTVAVMVESAGDYVTIHVQDTGEGMTQEELRQIGTPFYSLKSKGTGLGLMVCYNIVEKCNGRISFSSKKGEGTRVSLSFPTCENRS